MTIKAIARLRETASRKVFVSQWEDTLTEAERNAQLTLEDLQNKLNAAKVIDSVMTSVHGNETQAIKGKSVQYVTLEDPAYVQKHLEQRLKAKFIVKSKYATEATAEISAAACKILIETNWKRTFVTFTF